MGSRSVGVEEEFLLVEPGTGPQGGGGDRAAAFQRAAYRRSGRPRDVIGAAVLVTDAG
jgi:hypothetical protein